MEITKALDFVIDQFLVGRSCFAKRNEPIHLESLKFAFGPKNLSQNQEFIFLTQQCVYNSVPTDLRSFRTGPKKNLEDRSV